MANNQSPIYIAIFKKPTQAVLNAAEQITGVTTESKHLATLALETAINGGQVSVDRVGMTIDQYANRQIKPIPAINVGTSAGAAPWNGSVISTAPDDAWVSHLGRTNEHVKSIADSLSAARTDLDNRISNLGTVMTKKLSNLDNDLQCSRVRDGSEVE
jgi:hypothetical protein